MTAQNFADRLYALWENPECEVDGIEFRLECYNHEIYEMNRRDGSLYVSFLTDPIRRTTDYKYIIAERLNNMSVEYRDGIFILKDRLEEICVFTIYKLTKQEIDEQQLIEETEGWYEAE